MDVFKDQWEKQVRILTEAVDDITSVDDFLSVSGTPGLLPSSFFSLSLLVRLWHNIVLFSPFHYNIVMTHVHMFYSLCPEAQLPNVPVHS